MFKNVTCIFKHTNKLEQNNPSKQKVGHFDKTMLQIFVIFIILNTYVSLMFHAKIQQKHLAVLEKELVSIFLLFF